MHCVLLVDDEPLICEGLKRIINWEEFGVDTCISANGYDQAVQVLKERRIFMMITDIKMPGRDGIALLKEAAILQPACKNVVLSGYDDYQLVREAMKSGAFDYLLKPIQVEELTNTVSAAFAQKANNQRQQDMALLSRTMMQILTGELPSDMRRNRLEFYSFDPDDSALGVLLLYGPLTPDQTAELIVQMQLDGEFHMEVFPTDDGKTCVLFGGSLEGEFEGFKKCAKIIFDKLVAVCGNQLRGVLALGEDGWDAIQNIYQVAQIRLDNAIQTCYGNLATAICRTDVSLLQEHAILRQLLIEGERQAIKDYLQLHFENLNNEGTETPMEKAIAILNLAVRSIISEVIDKNHVFRLKEKGLNALKECKTTDEICQSLYVVLKLIVNTVTSQSEKKYSPVVMRVIAYVEENYADNSLCLKTLSDVLSMNAAYLGRVFRAEMNEFFGDYLSRVRIRQAEKLLIASSQSISEIAVSVGFSSASQFGRVFKKITMLSPSTLRELME